MCESFVATYFIAANKIFIRFIEIKFHVYSTSSEYLNYSIAIVNSHIPNATRMT